MSSHDLLTPSTTPTPKPKNRQRSLALMPLIEVTKSTEGLVLTNHNKCVGAAGLAYNQLVLFQCSLVISVSLPHSMATHKCVL